jgi:transcriptional regulator
MQAEGELIVNHIPFLLKTDDGDWGRLVGHVARANPVWKACNSHCSSVVIFHGPQSYISPSWYASKRDDPEVVPTWDYAVVHAHGQPRAIEDRDWLLELVTQLTEQHEGQRNLSWRVTDAPGDYIDRRLRAIVGVEIPITKLEGKWKVSQNRSEQDRQSVAASLQDGTGDDEQATAALVDQAINTAVTK